MMGKGRRGHIKLPPYLRSCGPDHGGLGPAGGMTGRDRGGDGNSFHGECLKVTIREKAKAFHI